MEVFTLIIAVIALVIAVVTYQRTGGIKDLRRRVEAVSSRTQEVRNDLQRRAESVSSKTQIMRDVTANSLGRLEKIVRGKGNDRNHQGHRSEETAARRSGKTSRRGLSSNSSRSSQL